ncbi:MAG: hypothetical protein IJB73_09105 [Firmicutes bacterium]|nr:hypothetical protein [Bacillota bacterium]
MFIEQKKKRNYRTFIYSAIIIVLCLLIIVIAWPADSAAQEENPPADNTLQTQLQNDFPVNGQPEDDDSEEDYSEDIGSSNEKEEEDNTVIRPAASAYYLVKRADGQIKVFFIDELGNQIELEDTEIIYEVLSMEDQKLFDEGITVKNQEELAVLLQDFES